MIDVREQDLTLVRQLLKKHFPECEVRAFGSRVDGTARKYSDLDLVLVGPESLGRKRIHALCEELEESPLSFTVDVLDWCRISPEFRDVVSRRFEVVQVGSG